MSIKLPPKVASNTDDPEQSKDENQGFIKGWNSCLTHIQYLNRAEPSVEVISKASIDRFVKELRNQADTIKATNTYAASVLYRAADRLSHLKD